MNRAFSVPINAYHDEAQKGCVNTVIGQKPNRVWLCGLDIEFSHLLARELGPRFDVQFGFGAAPPADDRIHNTAVLIDLRETGGFLDSGLRLIDEIGKQGRPVAILVILTGDDPIRRQSLIERGAYDTVCYPPDVVQLQALLERAHAWSSKNRQTDPLNRQSPHQRQVGNVVEVSDGWREVMSLARKAATCDATTLITGETGTGKELVARAIHEMSRRCTGPFLAFSCANLTDTLADDELFGHERGAFTGAIAPHLGHFEAAHGGTLFLDEIGDLPLDSQAKLLRVLQEKTFERLGGRATRRVDARVVCATHRDLLQMVEDHQFRDDLYYRLDVVRIHVPPLRKRREAIPALAQAFLGRFALQFGKKLEGFTSAALDALKEHDWPGNIRELENTIQRAVVLAEGTTIDSEHVVLADKISATLELPRGPELSGTPELTGASYEEQVRNFKTRLIQHAITEAKGNKSEAARRLSMARVHLHRLIRQLDLAEIKQGESWLETESEENNDIPGYICARA